MEFLADYGAFLLKTLTIVGAVFLIVVAIATASARNKSHSDGELAIKQLNEELEDFQESLEEAVLDKEVFKKKLKQKEKEENARDKKAKKEAKEKEKNKTPEVDSDEQEEERKRVFVLDFNGDIRASEVDLLRHEITAILTMARKEDEIVVRLESGGGMVHTYGLAASQLQRIRNKEIELTICVDEVAASGGYMMACIANRIVAAPFALVGSIGVMAQLPNFSKILKKNDVDYELFTAGEYKRTVTMFGHNSVKAKEKFQSDLEETHVLFKDHIHQFRPDIDLAQVANGDVWYGQQAVKLNLVDQIGTSDEYLVEACESADVFSVRYEHKKSLQEKLGIAVQGAAATCIDKGLTALQKQWVSKS